MRFRHASIRIILRTATHRPNSRGCPLNDASSLVAVPMTVSTRIQVGAGGGDAEVFMFSGTSSCAIYVTTTQLALTYTLVHT